MTKPGPKPLPVRVRGVDYASAYEAAEALGVTVGTVWWALSKGRADRIGLGRGCKGERRDLPPEKTRARPITLYGVTWPSRSAAAKALGYASHRTLRRSLHRWPDAVARRVERYLAEQMRRTARKEAARARQERNKAVGHLPRDRLAQTRSTAHNINRVRHISTKQEKE